MKTADRILQKALKIFAREGDEGLSMRRLATDMGIAQSVIYHHFDHKEQLLKRVFRKTSIRLGRKRRELPETDSASEMLKQRIAFQIDFSEEVVAVLKFYLSHRDLFPRVKNGFIPEKSYLHIQEVLERGVKTGEFIPLDIEAEAKVITHAINGFLLEYYPHKPTGSEKDALVEQISNFILRSIQK